MTIELRIISSTSMPFVKICNILTSYVLFCTNNLSSLYTGPAIPMVASSAGIAHKHYGTDH